MKTRIWAIPSPFRTSSNHTVSPHYKVVYSWLEREGVVSPSHVLITPHSRQLLDDRGRTLEEYGVTMDTKLVLEELED